MAEQGRDGSAGAPLLVAVDQVDDAEHEQGQRIRARFGLNNIDFAVLHHVDRVQRRRGTVRIGDLADRFGLSSAGATEVVHRLVLAGLLQRVAHPSDARVRRVELTPEATERMADAERAVRAELDALVARIPDEEQARLIELLGSIRDILRTAR